MDNLKNIIEKIKTDNGCNIDITYNLKDIKSGYMISLANYEKTIDLNDLNDLNNLTIQKNVFDAILEKIDIIKELKTTQIKSALYCGIWYNKDDKKLYIDISINIKNLRMAIERGIKENQYSIYDVQLQKDIELKTDVFIVYQYNKIKNDFIYLYECITRKELYNTLGISERHARDVIVNTIENYDTSKLYLNKYAIVKDDAFIRDLNY